MFKNKDLYSFHLQLKGLETNIIYQLIFGKIKDFYKHNSIRINTLIEKITAMQDDYFVLDAEGKVQQEGEPLQPIMKEGKTYDEYLEKYNELMEKECPIKF